MAQASNGDMADDRTTISVTEALVDELYDRKDRKQSYEDYIWELLEAENDE